MAKKMKHNEECRDGQEENWIVTRKCWDGHEEKLE